MEIDWHSMAAWYLPAYYTLIHALLERKPMDGVVEQVLFRQLFASDECRENSLRDRSR